MLTEEAGTERTLIDHQAERDTLRYVTETALEHATWRLQQTTSCTDFSDLTTTAFGDHSYAASVSPTAGSPIAITATGTLANGLALTRTRQAVPAYGVPTRSCCSLELRARTPTSRARRTMKITTRENDWKLKASSESGKEYHLLLEFDLTSVPVGSAILSATLELNLFNAPVDPDVIGIHRITRSWTEGGATWLTYDGNNDWDSPGGDYDPVQTSSFDTSTSGWRSADISTLVQRWVDSSQPNYGLALIPEVAASNSSNEFLGGDEDIDTHLRPKLTIVTRANAARPAPARCRARWLTGGSTRPQAPSAIDSEGGNDGALEGNPDWVDGVVGGALDFDGSGDRVVAGPVIESGTPEITIAAWVYKRDSGDDRVVSKSSSTSASAITSILWELPARRSACALRLKTTAALPTTGGT